MLFGLLWPLELLPSLDPVSTTLLSHPLRSSPSFRGFARGEPLTLSMFSSLRGHLGNDEDDDAGICGLKCVAEGTLPFRGLEGFDGEVVDGILVGEAGLEPGRGKVTGFARGLWGLGEGAKAGIRCVVRSLWYVSHGREKKHV